MDHIHGHVVHSGAIQDFARGFGTGRLAGQPDGGYIDCRCEESFICAYNTQNNPGIANNKKIGSISPSFYRYLLYYF